MALEKELALAIDFKKAPADLQKIATEHYANIKSVTKAKAKLVLAETEVAAAEKASAESEKLLRVALKNWNPEA